MTELRSVNTPLPRFAVVTDTGLIKIVEYAGNIASAVIMVEGKPMIAPVFQHKGWSLLMDLYIKENNLTHWRIYEDYVKHRRAEGANSVPSFPAEFLPKEVLARRENKGTSRRTWTPPTELEADPAPKRGKKAEA